MKIKLADFERDDILELLKQHVSAAHSQKATHVFDIAQLKQASMYVFSARDQQEMLMGIAGLKILNNEHAEIKSVRTHPEHLRKGVSTALMNHLAGFARSKNIQRLSLETHPTAEYLAARKFYENLGYEYCSAFGEYSHTETSVFMTKIIS